jgi:tRNA pseudouridine38-40 synthase
VPRVFRLTLEYDGEAFEGWQLQPGEHRTIQGTLETAVARVARQRVPVVGSGRTDSGVHAEGQVASLELETDLGADRLRAALNGVLPRDVAVVDAVIAPAGFHARRDASSKLYRYRVWNGRDRSPLRERRALCLQRPLNVEAMRRAARCFVGTHDFASFCAAGSSVVTTERSLQRLDVVGEGGGRVELLVEGSGFLRQMVRILAGTLLAVGSGRWRPEDMPAILAARDRRVAGPTAPAHGLTLVAVRYEPSAPREMQTGSTVDSDDSVDRSTS